MQQLIPQHWQHMGLVLCGILILKNPALKLNAEPTVILSGEINKTKNKLCNFDAALVKSLFTIDVISMLSASLLHVFVS